MALGQLTSFFTGSTLTLMIVGLALLIFVAIGVGVFLFWQYRKSFDIEATILKQRRDGYEIRSDKARQKSKADGANKLELLTTDGTMGRKARMDYPGERYFDQKDGQDHIYLLQIDGDTYVPVQVNATVEQENVDNDGNIDHAELEIDILDGEERQALISEIRNAEDTYNTTSMWDVISEKVVPIVMIAVATLGVILMINQFASGLTEVSQNLVSSSENVESAYSFCESVLQNQSGAAANESLIPGQTPAQGRGVQ